MRQTIKAYAKHVDKNPQLPYYSPNKGPNVKYVEMVMADAVAASNLREHEFIEGLYAKYGGDPADLPWNQR